MSNADTVPLPPRQTANPAPPRRANSVRRTCTIDIGWPDHALGDRLLLGRARDLMTPCSGGPGQVLAEATLEAGLRNDKTIFAISAQPSPARLHELVGQRGGNHLRLLIHEIMPELVTSAAPLYLLLDDISGTALVSNWTWAQWSPDWMGRLAEVMTPDQMEKFNQRANVCWGLVEGNSGLEAGGIGHSFTVTDGGELRNPLDPEGWHDFPEIAGPSFRRARRIDVWLSEDGGTIHIDAAFQDSAPRPEGGRAAIHEYCIAATADARSLELRTLAPEPRILPFHECPGAVANTQRLIGASLPGIREAVLGQLRGPAGCTHLNDALRALAEVPALAARLVPTG